MTQSPSRKNAIVVGMPRSGTSFAAAIFARQNYFLAEDVDNEFRTGDEHNPFGYWEANTLVEANVRILRRAGYNHHNTWRHPMISEASVAKIRDLEPTEEDREFVASYKQRSPWIWKDPRLCLTLSYWWKLMDPMDTTVLLTKRSAEATYRSFVRLDWTPGGKEGHDDVIRKVKLHVSEAERTLRDMRIPHMVMDYDKAMEGDGGADVARRIGETFGLQLADEDLNIRRDLNHSKLSSHLGVLAKRAGRLLPSPAKKAVKYFMHAGSKRPPA